MDDAQFGYVEGQLRPHFAALLARFEEAGQLATASSGAMFDQVYGPHPRQAFDLFPAVGAARARIVFFHAGYWQSRDKAQFRFLAPPLAAAGFDVVLANYPLCPDVTVAGLIDAAEAILDRLDDRLPIILSGHSAGGHIACELAMRRPCAGVLAISGVFDLEPLIGTTLNERLRLDAAAARAASPLHRVRIHLPDAAFIVGGDETVAFRDQNARMADAWRGAGNAAEARVVRGADHFTILDSLAAPDGVARSALERLVAAAVAD